MSECHGELVIRVGPTVVTSVKAPRGFGRLKDLDRQPFPEGSWWTVPVAAQYFGVTTRRIWNLCSVHRDRLGPSTYRRMAGQGKRYRILSEADIAVLRTLFPVYVSRVK